MEAGMSVHFVERDEIFDAINGAVIIALDFRDNGARLHLADGRTILLPGAETVYICASKWILQ
jgi:hypothetical protein